ncbi:MAG: hypothetical protein IPM42_03330 [Saprospiraceae bacterium]|nr:hypothetical protein [Saprospiraceae bacterium]
MKKLITWLVLGSLVVIVPLGSWFYLQKGLDYRKAALADLMPKDSIPYYDDSLNIFKGKTTLFVLGHSELSQENAQRIYDQYKDSYTFQVVSTRSIDSVPVNQISDDYLAFVFDKYKQNEYLLIDTFGRIRRFYPNTDAELKKVVEHLAIVMPRPVEKDIKMKQ